MLTNVRTGAAWPSVDPAGQWLYFSGYHVNGWEIERIRFDPAAAPPAPPFSADSVRTAAGMLAAGVATTAIGPPARVGGQIGTYSPWPTLLPRYWIPIGSLPLSGAGNSTTPRTKVLGASVGAFTSGVDLVGRHAYNVGARIFLPTGGYAGGRAAGFLSYGYAGTRQPHVGPIAIAELGRGPRQGEGRGQRRPGGHRVHS